ncbi:hypothetical protein [Herbaspirillum huttiense]|uniref:hypothetical protein n=1 Tax=Herbaspirillum huttiense TaxID=863372 RepID=UPI0031DEEF7B
MATGAPFLTFAQCEPHEARPWLLQAERKGRAPGGEGVETIMARGQCFMLGLNADPVAAYVLAVQGREVFILAAAGRADIDLTAAIDQVVTFQADGFDSVAFFTIRPGLKKKTAALGYAQDGAVMRKRLK